MKAEGKKKGYSKSLANRELSWLQFNERVQMEADNPANPLLERAKFLAIVTSNLDEFMQVRYDRIRGEARKKGGKRVQGGYTAKGLYRHVNKVMLHQQNQQYLLYEGIRSELYLNGVQLYPVFDITETLQNRATEIFKKEMRLNIKPLGPEEEPQQKQLHLLVKLFHPQRKSSRFVILALPKSLPRLYDLSTDPGIHLFIQMEDIIRQRLQQLFAKEQVEEAAVFRVLRNQNFEMAEVPGDNVEQTVRDMLRKRRTGVVMRLEAEERMNEEMLEYLMGRFGLSEKQKYRVTGPLDLNKLMMNLYGELRRADLKYVPAEPLLTEDLMGEDIFEQIARKDRLLFHPYHSFDPIVHFIQQAAKDPKVRAIRQVLFRVSANSPIVQALKEAVENGKEVMVLFEAHARFDEENNLFWGDRLRQAGCRVMFGLPGLKVHSKITLVEREEDSGLRCYLHLGTGNYQEGTAKMYTDFGLLTADSALGADGQLFFQSLEGVVIPPMEAMVKSPEALQTTLLHLIEREKEHALEGRSAGIVAKMNSLVDKKVISALYDAAGAGVSVCLIVRGICCLIPEREGQSENIRVHSIVGRHLEHARAFRFENGGESQIYLSSADWMPRNLERRVELMFPVTDPDCKLAVENVLALQWRDTEKTFCQMSNGKYARKRAGSAETVNAQDQLLHHLPEIFASRELAREEWKLFQLTEREELAQNREEENEDGELESFGSGGSGSGFGAGSCGQEPNGSEAMLSGSAGASFPSQGASALPEGTCVAGEMGEPAGEA